MTGVRVRARRVAARAIVTRPAGDVFSRVPATGLLVARAAFRTGRDRLCEAALERLARRDPDSVPAAVLRADLRTFQGRYREALAAAEAAATSRSAAATARLVRLSYRVRERDEAQRVAVAAAREFPRSVEVLWQVALACDQPAQYERLERAWRAAATAPADLLPVVRPLAVAAARAGRLDAATGWYRRAVELLLHTGRPAPVPTTRLAGLGAHRAIRDLCRVLDSAGVPFFFAAGTALGLIRQGRPLGADGDIDVGIFEPDWQPAGLIELFTQDPSFDLDPHPQTEKVGLRHRGGSPVDIFRFYEQAGVLWHDGVFVRWRNSPFRVTRRRIGRLRVPLPADPDRYLTETYGDWRTPMPGFDAFTDDAPNLEVTWPDYQRMHLVRRGYTRLAAGDPAGARQELARAGEPELAAKLAAVHPDSG